MLIHEAVYDIDTLLQENLHIHTTLFSGCARPEMVFEDIVRTAAAFGLRRIAVTDHVQERDITRVRNIMKTYKPARDALAQQENITVHIGAELSAFDTDKFTLQYSDASTEFNMYAANHYHVYGWGQPAERTAVGYKEHNKKAMEFLIRSGKCDCIAHPFVDSYVRDESIKNDDHPMTAAWTDNEIGDILTLAKQYDVAWELPPKIVLGDPVFGRRLFNIGKEVGSVFTMGTDAHWLVNIDTSVFKDDYKRVLLK